MDPGVAMLSDNALSLMGDALPEIDLEKLIAAAKSPPEGARIEKMEIYPRACRLMVGAPRARAR